jgi:hypothetical protein
MTGRPLSSLVARVCSRLLNVSCCIMCLVGLWTIYRGIEADDGGAKMMQGVTLFVWAVVVGLPAWLFDLWRWRHGVKHDPPPGGGG